jgi:hypothetical protein
VSYLVDGILFALGWLLVGIIVWWGERWTT